MYRLFVKIKHLPILSTVNLSLAEFIHRVFLASAYNFGTVYTLTYKCFQICLSWTKLHNELLFSKTNFLKNGYPENFTNNILKNVGITYI